MIFGVIFGVILTVVLLCCKKRRNGRRTCGIPMKEKRKLATTVSNSKQNLVGNMKENSSDSSPLLKKNISLRQDKTPENFMDGIASEWDKKINWKKFLRKTPAPSLTEIEISDVEHNCGRQAEIYEKIFQCLLIWYKKQSHDVFPLKELLQVLYELDKPLVHRLLEKYCMCEDTAN
ncbi:uncharacterized protein [Ptychodera flava]|uniref:uncharacterized protein n=1 Tax=Ptychodera flava TaxID=63121 RepID=UPI00396A2CF0